MVLFSSCPTKCQQLSGEHPPISLLNRVGVGEERCILTDDQRGLQDMGEKVLSQKMLGQASTSRHVKLGRKNSEQMLRLVQKLVGGKQNLEGMFAVALFNILPWPHFLHITPPSEQGSTVNRRVKASLRSPVCFVSLALHESCFQMFIFYSESLIGGILQLLIKLCTTIGKV